MRRTRATQLILAFPAPVLVAFLAVRSPWISAGVVLGFLMLLLTVWQPLLVLGIGLFSGPYDLSLLTGGFKSLFVELGGLDMNGIRLMGLTVGLGGLALVAPRMRATLLGREGLPYTLWILFCAFSVVHSTAPLDGMRLLLKVAFPLLVFATIAGIARTPAQVRGLLTWIMAGAALIALVVTPITALFGGVAIDDAGVNRVVGPGIHQNPFSFYLAITLLLSLSLFVAGWGVRMLLLCLPLGLWIVLSLTRITLLGTLLALVAMAVLWAFAARNFRLLWLVSVAGGLLALFMTPPVLQRTFGHVPGPAELVSLLAHPIQLYEIIDWQGRERLWPLVVAMFLANPVLGAGAGATTPMLRAAVGSDIGPVHNEYLRLLAETGLVGFILFVVVLLWWGRLAVRLALEAREATTRAVAVAAFGGVVAWSIFGLTDNAFDYYSSFTQYVGALMGCALALATFERQWGPEPR